MVVGESHHFRVQPPISDPDLHGVRRDSPRIHILDRVDGLGPPEGTSRLEVAYRDGKVGRSVAPQDVDQELKRCSKTHETENPLICQPGVYILVSYQTIYEKKSVRTSGCPETSKRPPLTFGIFQWIGSGMLINLKNRRLFFSFKHIPLDSRIPSRDQRWE